MRPETSSHQKKITNFINCALNLFEQNKSISANSSHRQGSVLSPLLLVVVMEALTQDVREGLPWELLYADDLVLMAESIEELKGKVLRWKECMEAKGLKMNVGKTKVMVSGKN